jgi:hypothetical protein
VPEFACLAVALFFAWLFALSAWHKLRHPQFYRSTLGSWLGLTPGRWVVSALALLESGLVFGLLVPASRSAALVAVADLLLAYALGMAWLLLRGRGDEKCGCAGPDSDTTISSALVWRNLLCAQLAVLAANPVGAGSSLVADGVAVGIVTLLSAGFLCLLYLCCEQLISNAQHISLENR